MPHVLHYKPLFNSVCAIFQDLRKPIKFVFPWLNPIVYSLGLCLTKELIIIKYTI